MKALAVVGAMLVAVALQQAQAGQPRGSGLTFQTPLPSYVPPDSPKPQANAVTGYDAAPLPEDDLPGKQTAETSRDGITPTLFRPRHQYRGEAFTPGSSVDGTELGNVRPGFGLSVTQPMQ